MQSVDAEVSDYVIRFADCRDEKGRRPVTRNRHKEERTILTGIGPVSIKQPSVNDRRVDENGQRLHFEGTILPPYLRRTKSIDKLIPWLYLRGISTGDFTDALQVIFGPASIPQILLRGVERILSCIRSELFLEEIDEVFVSAFSSLCCTEFTPVPASKEMSETGCYGD